MKLLVRRDLNIFNPRESEAEALSSLPDAWISRIGKPWIDVVSLDESAGRVTTTHHHTLTPQGWCDSWARWHDTGQEVAFLRRRTLEALWNDPWADYLLQNHPDLFLASSGGMWTRPDLWVGEHGERLVHAEWLNATYLAWAHHSRVAIVSVVPSAWEVGTVVISVIDLNTNEFRRLGPWAHGQTDVLEWSPRPDELWTVLRDVATNDDAIHAIDLTQRSVVPTRFPQDVQGISWRADGLEVAVAHGGASPGITIYGPDASQHFPVGFCWTPAWLGEHSLAFGSRMPTEDAPGDRICYLDVRDGSTVDLMASSPFAAPIHVSARISDSWFAPRQAADRWWGDLLLKDEARDLPTVSSLRSLHPDAEKHMLPKMRTLFYDDPQLYEAQVRSADY